MFVTYIYFTKISLCKYQNILELKDGNNDKSDSQLKLQF